MSTFAPVLLLVALAACGRGVSDEDAVLAKRRARTKQICACEDWRCVAQATIDYDRWVALRQDRLRAHQPSPAVKEELARLDREAHTCEAVPAAVTARIDPRGRSSAPRVGDQICPRG